MVFDRRRRLCRTADGTVLLVGVDGDPRDAIECECDGVGGTVVSLRVRAGGRARRAEIPSRGRRVLVALPEQSWLLATVVRVSDDDLIEIRPVLPVGGC